MCCSVVSLFEVEFRFLGKIVTSRLVFVKGLFQGSTLVLFTWFLQVFLCYSNKGIVKKIYTIKNACNTPFSMQGN